MPEGRAVMLVDLRCDLPPGGIGLEEVVVVVVVGEGVVDEPEATVRVFLGDMPGPEVV